MMTAGVWLLAMALAGQVEPAQADWRHISAGYEIPSEGYCDQPYVVITDEGHWLCTMTTGPANEGDARQHVVAAISTDQGRTWSELIDIEPHGPPEASWVMPLKVPSGRIYAFYVYNADNLREVIASTDYARRRVDTLGHYVFRYSDDGGRTWSAERRRVPIRNFEIDRENPYRGEVQFFWGVGKPLIHDGAAYIGLAKVGSFGETFIERSEGFFLRSGNIVSASDPASITWETLPEGDIGLRAPRGPIAEEHNLTFLSGGSLYCTYRTIDGHPCHAYSRDGGKTWTGPEYMTYTPDGRRIKHPRAANFVRRFSNGKYLYWFHNHGGTDYEGRNPAWVSGGVEKDGHLHWSQPEILLYADDPRTRMSYPDFIEDNGRYFVTETQKAVARVHEIDPGLLEGLWRQHEHAAMTRPGPAMALREADCAPGVRAAMPRLPDLTYGTGFTLELWFSAPRALSDRTMLEARSGGGRLFGLGITQSGALRIELDSADGASYAFDSGPGVLRPGERQHAVIIVDGGPRLVMFVVDGMLCDGGDERPQGWHRLPSGLKNFGGTGVLHFGEAFPGTVHGLRIYDRYLRVSEAVGNYRAGLLRER